MNVIKRDGKVVAFNSDKIKTAIKCGISKININTELQLAWANSVKNFINEKPNVYDPRKIIGSGEKDLKKAVRDKLELFANI